MFTKDPNRIWEKYQRIKDYCTKNGLFEQVKKNENFYDGNQWIGANGEEIKTDMPKPVINILQQVAKSQISVVSSNDVSVTMTPFSNSQEDLNTVNVFAKQVEKIIEQAKIKENARAIVKDAFVDGSAFLLTEFDANVETGQDMKGIIKSRIIPNTRMYFGNMYDNNIQEQPYIIISLRQEKHQVKAEAKRLGLKEEDIDSIQPDNDYEQVNDDSTDLVTVLLTYFKVDGVVHMCKSTKNLFLIEDTDMGYTRYPISCFGWDQVKNSYIYKTPFSANIVNQVFINKTYSLLQYNALMNGTPKILYDKNKINIDDFFANEKQAVIGMDLSGQYLNFIKAPDVSSQMLPLADNVISKVKEGMGSSDTSMGDVQPDNTSAIIALQEATNSKLELQRQQYYTFWEDVVRNIVDMMVCDYGVRAIITDDGVAIMDFGALRQINYELNVDIGAGAQYSEIAQINTADKLFQTGVIDPYTYVSIIPDKYILGKNKIMDYLKNQMALQQQQMMQQPLTNEQMPL